MRVALPMHFVILLAAGSLWAADVAKTLPAAPQTEQTPPHKIWEPPFYNGAAAQVEKTIISYDDIRREMAPLSANIRANSQSAEEYEQRMEALYQQTLQGLVDRALLIAEFKARGYKVPAKETDNEYRKILKESFDNKVSDLVASLQQQGLTLPAYRKRLEENLMVSALQGRFRRELPDITPEQIQAYYNANLDKFSHSGSVRWAVITLKPMTDEPAHVLHQTATEIADKIKAGKDFNKVAEENNQEGNPDWGWLDTKELSENVKEAIAGMKVGELSEPVIIDGPKVLLIKLLERKNEGVAPLQQVREDIKRTLFEEQGTAAYKKWIDQLMKKYFVKINT